MTLQGVDDIRLVGANSTVEGRVEVFHDGEWGTVCDDSFDLNDAHVICRQLKLGRGVEARSRAKYGQGTGKIFIDDLQCTGTERNIKNCQMRAGKYACALVGVHGKSKMREKLRTVAAPAIRETFKTELSHRNDTIIAANKNKDNAKFALDSSYT